MARELPALALINLTDTSGNHAGGRCFVLPGFLEGDEPVLTGGEHAPTKARSAAVWIALQGRPRI